MEGDDVKKRALLVIYNAAHFRELLRLAQLLLKSGAYVPVLLFVSPYPGLSTHYQQCVSLGVRAIVRGQSLQKKTHRWLVTIALIPSAFLQCCLAFSSCHCAGISTEAVTIGFTNI
jgi:hypothetical protein